MAKISPHAVVDPQASLAEDVEVGPFCVIGPEVVLGEGCLLYNHVTMLGIVTVGRDNVFYPNAVIGSPPQDRKYKGAPTRVEIGANNQFHEAVTIHRGTEKGGGVTRLGNNNLLMVNTHVGHDAQIGSGCTLTNNVMIAGHVVIGDNVNMAGGVGVHHFVTVGDFAFIGGYSRIRHDAPPYCRIDGADQIRGVNAVGLRRGGVSEADIEGLESAARVLFYAEKPLAVAMAEFDTQNGINQYVKRLIEFLRRRAHSRRGRHLEDLHLQLQNRTS